MADDAVPPAPPLAPDPPIAKVTATPNDASSSGTAIAKAFATEAPPAPPPPPMDCTTTPCASPLVVPDDPVVRLALETLPAAVPPAPPLPPVPPTATDMANPTLAS